MNNYKFVVFIVAAFALLIGSVTVISVVAGYHQKKEHYADFLEFKKQEKVSPVQVEIVEAYLDVSRFSGKKSLQLMAEDERGDSYLIDLPYYDQEKMKEFKLLRLKGAKINYWQYGDKKCLINIVKDDVVLKSVKPSSEITPFTYFGNYYYRCDVI